MVFKKKPIGYVKINSGFETMQIPGKSMMKKYRNF